MSYIITKYALLIVSTSIITCLTSCYYPEPPAPPRPVTCEMPEDYNYLDYYEKWREPICTTELCSIYTAIWKELKIEQSTLTEPYFDNHFKIVSSEIVTGSKSDYFQIGYRVQNDWAIAEGGDRFIIKIAEGATDFPEIGLPKGDYLIKEEIAAAVDYAGFNSWIQNIPKTGPLKFSTREEALRTLISAANVDTMCFYRVTLSISSGTLTLNAYAQYADAENECIEGDIDLITGGVLIWDKKCSNSYDR